MSMPKGYKPSPTSVRLQQEGMLRRFGLPFVGKKFGRLTIQRVEIRPGTGWLWAICSCECGNSTEVRLPQLKRGDPMSCGCLFRELRKLPSSAEVARLYTEDHLSTEQIAVKFGLKGSAPVRLDLNKSGVARRLPGKHRQYKTPEYQAWHSMKRRCMPNHPAGYYARGIRVCREWQKDFESFRIHIGPRPSLKHSVDRIKNHQGYRPGNVRWATAKEQMRNTRANVLLKFRGEKLPLVIWAERFGLRGATIQSRLQRGWSLEKALTTKTKEQA